MTKVLSKANDDLISHCMCVSPLATTGQMDCPWCGCGWLFSCMNCRKAFTFAVVVEIDQSLHDIIRRDMRTYGLADADISEDDVRETAAWFAAQIDPLPLGTICVILDGEVIPSERQDIVFEGWFARHDLKVAPQVAALADRAILDEVLSNKQYWLEREIGDEDAE